MESRPRNSPMRLRRMPDSPVPSGNRSETSISGRSESGISDGGVEDTEYELGPALKAFWSLNASRVPSGSRRKALEVWAGEKTSRLMGRDGVFSQEAQVDAYMTLLTSAVEQYVRKRAERGDRSPSGSVMTVRSELSSISGGRGRRQTDRLEGGATETMGSVLFIGVAGNVDREYPVVGPSNVVKNVNPNIGSPFDIGNQTEIENLGDSPVSLRKAATRELIAPKRGDESERQYQQRRDAVERLYVTSVNNAGGAIASGSSIYAAPRGNKQLGGERRPIEQSERRSEVKREEEARTRVPSTGLSSISEEIGIFDSDSQGVESPESRARRQLNAKGKQPMRNTSPERLVKVPQQKQHRASTPVQKGNKNQIGVHTQGEKPTVASTTQRVARAVSFADRTIYQRYRDEDIEKGQESLYDDQGIAFVGRMAVEAEDLEKILSGKSRRNGRERSAKPTQRQNSGERSQSVTPGRGVAQDDGSEELEPLNTATSQGRERLEYSMPPPDYNRGSTMPGSTLATQHHRRIMRNRLTRLIQERLQVRPRLPDTHRSRRFDSKAVDQYQGSPKFSELENWLTGVCVHMESVQYGGEDMDGERVRVTSELLTGEAKKWYNHQVVNINREKKGWTFEEVILGLYSRFVHASTTQDARSRFYRTRYSTRTGVQGYYETLLSHAQNMVVYPDQYTLISTFLRGLPEGLKVELIKTKGLVPEVHRVEEFVSAAKAWEEANQTYEYFSQLGEAGIPVAKLRESRGQGQSAEPQKESGQDKPNGGNLGATNPKGYREGRRESGPREGRRDNGPRESRRDNAPRDETRRNTRNLTGRKDDGNQPKPGEKTSENVCYECGKPGHYARDCKSGKKEFLKAAHTEVPESGGDDPQSEEPQDGSDSGGESDQSSHHTVYSEVKFDGNEYYTQQSDSEDALRAMSVLAADDHLAANEAGPVGVKKNDGGQKDVVIRRSHSKRTRPTVAFAAKECLASYVEVGGVKAWALWDSGSTTTGVTPAFAQVANIRKIGMALSCFVL
ncbi:hypothetical protein BDN72DRAFT_914011 [Pluteus cervinus]|uniref:Uncharacterized protein n=1 Tax=Pluteus cervinus TaxID=181527 RepID=A0ACD2ZY88_9AGAR|nr:hypothetical protein BDN72DRAFT_914011 [Pluteus cervinus]